MNRDAIVDLLIIFDTTGSMYPCLASVRKKAQALTKKWASKYPNLRVAVITHGDYCDGPNTIHEHDFDVPSKAVQFIEKAPATGGGDAPECYELALHEARKLSWRAGAKKIAVMIGDDVPHPANDRQNTRKLDWKNELQLLLEAKIKVFAVQALARKHATPFWQKVAEITDGVHLELEQFEQAELLLEAGLASQFGKEDVEEVFTGAAERGDVNRSMLKVFEALLRGGIPEAWKAMAAEGMAKKTGSSVADITSRFKAKVPDGLNVVPPGRFQVFKVEESTDIECFVKDMGLLFKKGRGFYEWVKSEKVQHHKEVVLVDRVTGVSYTGKDARKMLNLPDDGEKTISPKSFPEIVSRYQVFIQSTSNNRKLPERTAFLYEVHDYAAAAAA